MDLTFALATFYPRTQLTPSEHRCRRRSRALLRFRAAAAARAAPPPPFDSPVWVRNDSISALVRSDSSLASCVCLLPSRSFASLAFRSSFKRRELASRWERWSERPRIQKGRYHFGRSIDRSIASSKSRRREYGSIDRAFHGKPSSFESRRGNPTGSDTHIRMSPPHLSDDGAPFNPPHIRSTPLTHFPHIHTHNHSIDPIHHHPQIGARPCGTSSCIIGRAGEERGMMMPPQQPMMGSSSSMRRRRRRRRALAWALGLTFLVQGARGSSSFPPPPPGGGGGGGGMGMPPPPPPPPPQPSRRSEAGAAAAGAGGGGGPSSRDGYPQQPGQQMGVTGGFAAPGGPSSSSSSSSSWPSSSPSSPSGGQRRMPAFGVPHTLLG